MTEHKLFYYPYASLTNVQLPLLKVAALYFDKLVILDPVGASWDTIGTDYLAREAIKQLQDAGILEVVSPAAVLAKYEIPISAAIRRDMDDRGFLELCEAQSRASGKQRWTLSLAKVPQDLQTDQAMRNLMGDFARHLLFDSYARAMGEEYVDYDETEVGAILDQAERFKNLRESAPKVDIFDEYREGYDGDVVEYRYGDFPLALGEAIMLNHALFAGLLHAGATPITDDQFHNQALSLKLRRASQDPTIREAQADRALARKLKADQLVATALTDSQLNLPILNPKLPLDEVLEYRQKHADALCKARDKLGWMARRIEAEPWSEEFAAELEYKTIPDIATELDAVREARDAWLKDKRVRLALSATGITVGAAAAVLSIFSAPLAPLALTTAGLSLVSGAAIPGVEWLLDWRNGKKSAQENGLHYFLKI